MTLDEKLSTVLSHLENTAVCGTSQHGTTQWKARCPAHDDREQHLYISTDPLQGKIILDCKHHCTFDSIVLSMGLQPKDLFLNDGQKLTAPNVFSNAPHTVIKRRNHDYRNENGVIICRKSIERLAEDDEKHVSWYRFENGKPILGLKGKKAPLYNLDKLAANYTATDQQPIFIAEGEKDCDTLSQMGLVATTSPNGAGSKKWLDTYNTYLNGGQVYILTDNDQPGERHGVFIANQLVGIASSVKIIPATAIHPTVKPKGDISDIAAEIGLENAKIALEQAVSRSVEYTKELPELITQDETTAPETPIVFSPKCASDYEEDDTRFLWYPYLPVGDYTVIMSAGGTGKTMLTCGIAAALSKTEAFPGEEQPHEAAKTLFISSEDTGSMLKKRLSASGADLSKILILDCNDSIGLNIDTGHQTFEKLVEETTPKLVIIDPWTAFIGSIDINRANIVRPVFQRLANIAKKHDCSVILVSHVNKKAQSDNANNAAIGSADLVNAARSTLQIVGGSPDEKDSRIMVHTKSNYAPAGKSVKYRITAESGMQWAGFSNLTKEILEDAARWRKTPYEALAKYENEEAPNTDLINAIKNIAKQAMEKPDKTRRISYDETKDLFGATIFGNMTPQKALEKISPILLDEGISIATSRKVKYNGDSRNGYAVFAPDAEKGG